MDERERKYLIEEIEHAHHYGQRVSVMCDDRRLIGGFIEDTGPESFVIRDGEKRSNVLISEVLMFDNLDAG